MCKACQYCIESCYWHLIEKRFCYDENIALYEDPTAKERKLSNAFENMAFYDQVSLIAGRAIVTIDPLPKQPKPIEHQPARRIRWWEDNVDEQNKENEAKNREQKEVKDLVVKQHKNKQDSKIIHQDKDDKQQKTENESTDVGAEISKNEVQNQLRTIMKVSSVPTILEASTEDLTSSMEELDSIIRQKVSIAVPNTDEVDSNRETPKNQKEKSQTQLLTINETVKMRKKSLRERRMSRSLTINIDRNLELPVIRQLSMPKFYLDTPEVNQTDSSILALPSSVLTSPVMPRSSQFDFFDLRSVVQMEKECRAHSVHNPVPVHRQQSPHSRLVQIKEKLKSTKLKRQGSATNLPNSIHHI